MLEADQVEWSTSTAACTSRCRCWNRCTAKNLSRRKWHGTYRQFSLGLGKLAQSTLLAIQTTTQPHVCLLVDSQLSLNNVNWLPRVSEQMHTCPDNSASDVAILGISSPSHSLPLHRLLNFSQSARFQSCSQAMPFFHDTVSTSSTICPHFLHHIMISGCCIVTKLFLLVLHYNLQLTDVQGVYSLQSARWQARHHTKTCNAYPDYTLFVCSSEPCTANSSVGSAVSGCDARRCETFGCTWTLYDG